MCSNCAFFGTFSMVSTCHVKRLSFPSYIYFVPRRPYSLLSRCKPNQSINNGALPKNSPPLRSSTKIMRSFGKLNNINPAIITTPSNNNNNNNVWKCNHCKMTNESTANSHTHAICFACGKPSLFDTDTLGAAHNTSNILKRLESDVPNRPELAFALFCKECGLIQYCERRSYPSTCNDCGSLKLEQVNNEVLPEEITSPSFDVTTTTASSALDLIETLHGWENKEEESSFPFELIKITQRLAKGKGYHTKGKFHCSSEWSHYNMKNKVVRENSRPLYPIHVLSLFHHHEENNYDYIQVPLSLQYGILKTTVTQYQTPVFLIESEEGDVVEELSSSSQKIEYLIEVLKETKNKALRGEDNSNSPTDYSDNDYSYSDECKSSGDSHKDYSSMGTYQRFDGLPINCSSIRTIEVMVFDGDLDRFIYIPSTAALRFVENVLLPEDVWRAAWLHWGRYVILQKTIELIAMYRMRDPKCKRPEPEFVKQQLQTVIWGLLEGIEVRLDSMPLYNPSSSVIWRCSSCDLINEQCNVQLSHESLEKVCYACGKDEVRALEDKITRESNKTSKTMTNYAVVSDEGGVYYSDDGEWSASNNSPNATYNSHNTDSFHTDCHIIDPSTPTCSSGWSTDPYHSWKSSSVHNDSSGCRNDKYHHKLSVEASPVRSATPAAYTPKTSLGRFLDLGVLNSDNKNIKNTFGDCKSSFLPPGPALDLTDVFDL